jgi:ATP-dependent helicase HrpB
LIEDRRTLRWNDKENRIEARLEKRLGAIMVKTGPDPAPDPDDMARLLLETARERLEKILPKDLLARANFIGLSELSSEKLRENTDAWLGPLLHGRRNLDLGKGALVDAVLGQLEWSARQRLDHEAPRQFTSPAGTSHAVDYTGDDAPSVEVRVQAMFGLDRHPMIGRMPLLLKLTSPAGRPVQATRDLPAFWRGSWADVRKDMKGRYPKHRWPEEPWVEKPSLKTKNAFSKGQG